VLAAEFDRGDAAAHRQAKFTVVHAASGERLLQSISFGVVRVE
jgi:hypothetical protein